MQTPDHAARPLVKWHSKSGVTRCDECDGQGAVWNGRGRGGCDPDSWDIECEACEGNGFHPCAVCGFDMDMAGYDCLACETVASIASKDLPHIDAATFTAAFVKALAASRAADNCLQERAA
jgi:hypothetical protein